MSAIAHSNTEQRQTIYIQLLNEGTYVTRPTQAIVLEKGLYKILPTSNYDPANETWQFLPGAIVQCEEKIGTQGKYLLAVAEVG